MDIAVIGAGASGIFAALAASQSGARVTLIDHNARIGKKLLVTGSGRCNLSNSGLSPEAYSCADPDWMRQFLLAFPLTSLIQELEGYGIPVHHSQDGWYYPLSDSAHAMVEILQNALEIHEVELLLSTQVTDFQLAGGHFLVHFPSRKPARTRSFDKLVLAAGGKAYPALGSRGELFPSLARCGHAVVPLLPALGPLELELGSFKSLQGQRLDVASAIYAGTECLGQSHGNIIITPWGMNGPGVMNLSHLAARYLESQSQNRLRQRLTLTLDLLAYYAEAFGNLLDQRKTSRSSVKAFLEAFFVPRVAEFFLAENNISTEMPLRDLSEGQLTQLVERLHNVSFTIVNLKGFEQSQLSAGGVPVTEVDPCTCQSRLIPGLYLVGETLDVVGPCGGFNLHFAFGSGCLAGRQLALQHKTVRRRSNDHSVYRTVPDQDGGEAQDHYPRRAAGDSGEG